MSTVYVIQPSSSVSKSSSDRILALLQKLNKSNRVLTSGFDRTENRSSLNSTPLIPRTQAQGSHQTLSHEAPLPSQAM